MLKSRAADSEIAIKGTSEQIADRLREEIEQGLLPPDSALNQVEIAARFGLSRIPVREALRQLEAEGYVQYRPNKGATVAGALRPEEVVEVIEIRECLESRLMDRAATRCSPEQLRRANEALRSMNHAESMAQLRGLHEHFHTILFEAAGRPRMASIINDWRFRLDSRPDKSERMRAFVRATGEVHKQLLRACEDADRTAVRRCVSEEYRIVRSFVVNAPRKLGN